MNASVHMLYPGKQVTQGHNRQIYLEAKKSMTTTFKNSDHTKIVNASKWIPQFIRCHRHRSVKKFSDNHFEN